MTLTTLLPKAYQQKRQVRLVEQFHSEFDAAADGLIVQANAILKKQEDSRALRLKSLGFTATPEAESITSMGKITVANNVLYYAEKYPNNKFITLAAAKAVAQRYGLVIGEVSAFTGRVPDKNLAEIEAFKVDAADRPLDQSMFAPFLGSALSRIDELKRRGSVERKSSYAAFVLGDLHIIAPLSEMKLDKRQKVVGGLIITHDPIVLCPVGGGFLVVSKWGPEASAPELQ